MSKNILVISSSLRSGSNSEALADSFIKGAEDAGNKTEKILLNKSIDFCEDCFASQKMDKTVTNYDEITVMKIMHDADVIVFAMPIYYYDMSGQMKILIDHASCLYSSDYKSHDIYFLSAAAEKEDDIDEQAGHILKKWFNEYPKFKFCGTVFAGGVNGPNEMSGHPALKKAYDMGNSIK